MSRLFPILSKVIAAWQAKDVEAVLAHMADDIVWHYAAPGLPPVRGKAAAEKLLRQFQSDMHDIQWRIFNHAEAGNLLFLEGVDDYRTTDGKRMAVPYAGVLEFRDERIAGWRDYVDLGVIADQKAGEPFTKQVEALLARETTR
jgi:limonene-1,2-epoxide hydrolase